MKYIRTKDGIFKSNEYLLSNEDLQSIAVCKGLGINPYKDVKTADTIEELLDLILCWQGKWWGFFMPIELEEIDKEKWNKIYGAIWTDKGLIYVAKMNKEGELELL